MKRRQALQLLAGGTLLAVPLWRYPHLTAADAVAAVVRKHLGYLRLDPGSVQRFAADYVNAQLTSTMKLRALSIIEPVYALLPQALLSRDLRRGEDRIVTQFLLSTDFFTGGEKLEHVVRYLGLFDPLRACSNPFARPVQSSESHEPANTGMEAA
jgi:hypothetical protein